MSVATGGFDGIRARAPSRAPPFTDKACYDAPGTADLIRLMRFTAERQYHTVEFHFNDKTTWKLWQGKITYHQNHDEHLHCSVGDWHRYSKAEAKAILSQPVMKSLPFFLKRQWFVQEKTP